MPAKFAMNVSPTPQLTQFVQVKVATGRYRSVSEVIRAALRLLEQQHRRDCRPEALAAHIEDQRDAR